ncbi:MAG TPA: polysaccharide biosynthesis protein, partial [Ktedonobacteraceae bacterium]|nr:polysaccharide biosynthesis protein [Ktedonobacteraceae bacterium]
MTTADPALRKVLFNQHVVLYLRQYALAPATLRTIGILVGFLLLLLNQLYRNTFFLEGAIILIGGCLVLSLPFMWRKRFTPLVAPGGNGDARPLEITDLLERPVVPLNMDEIYPSLQGRVVLVTGAAGSIGSELCRQLLGSDLAALIAVDINETGLFDLVEDLRVQAHPHVDRLHPFIGDIADLRRFSRLLADKRPYIIFHVAAYKHVPLLEQHADLAVRTNALATYDLCRLAQEYQVAQFVYVSTDKAACPVSVMGATKRLAEIIVQGIATSAPGP